VFPVIYLDKNKLHLPGSRGSWADIKEGLLCEIKWANNKPGNTIEWLKIQLE
jgi:hypothetical protein